MSFSLGVKKLLSRRRVATRRPQSAKLRSLKHRTPRIDPLEERRLLAMTYTLTPLGDLAGGEFMSQAHGINNSGTIAGTGTPSFVHEEAFRYDVNTGQMVSIGLPPSSSGSSQVGGTIPIIDGADKTIPLLRKLGGISDTGLIAGRAGSSTGSTFASLDPLFPLGSGANQDRAFLWDPNTQTFTVLPTFEMLNPTGDSSKNWGAAAGVNSSGQVIGSSGKGSLEPLPNNPDLAAPSRGFIWAAENRNEQQSIRIANGTPTSGTFKLNFMGQTTTSLAYNATPTAVRNALGALSMVGGTANVQVVAGSEPLSWDVTFVNARGNMNLASLTTSESTLNNGATFAISTTVQGAKAGLTDIGDLSGGHNSSRAHGVNNAGAVVGQGSGSLNTGNNYFVNNRAIYWDPVRELVDLHFNGQTHPIKVTLPDGTIFTQPATTVQVVEEIENQDFYLTISSANDINSNGLVVGEILTQEAGIIAGIWDTTKAVGDVDSFFPIFPFMEGSNPVHNTRALAINDFGTVVGTSRLPGADELNAWVYQIPPANKLFPDLPAPLRAKNLNELITDGSNTGWTLQVATDINEFGRIVGYGINPQGKTEAFLLTPVNDAPTLAPLENVYVDQGQLLTVNLTATDSNGDLLRFTIPDSFKVAAQGYGLQIVQNTNTTATITWTPGALARDQITVPVTVTDDGVGFRRQTLELNIGVNRDVNFADNFESGTLNAAFWAPITSSADSRVAISNSLSVGNGIRSLVLDSQAQVAGKDLSGAVLTLNLSGVGNPAAGNTAILTFQHRSGLFGSSTTGNDYDNLGDAAHAIGALGDGIAISSDGVNFYRIYDATQPANILQQAYPSNFDDDGLWHLAEFDLGAEINRINAQFPGANLSFNSTFQIKFTSYEAGSFPDQGVAIDNVKIAKFGQFIEPSMDGEIFHRIETGDPDELYRVGFFGNVTANTPILVSVHGAGREIAGHTSYWQSYIADPANGVDSLIVVAPFYREGGKFDQYGRLGWGFNSTTAADLSLLKFLDELTTTTGLGDDSELYLFGFSRGTHFVEAFAAAHPDRVAAVVAASGDRQMFPVDNVDFPYGVKESVAIPAPTGVELSAEEYAKQRIMIWVGQSDTLVVTDQSNLANLQGLLRTERALNNFASFHDAIDTYGLTPDQYEHEFFVQEGRGHEFLPADMDTFYEFLFRQTPTAPLDQPLDVVPVIVTSPTTTERQANLPNNEDYLFDQGRYWIEIWVHTNGATGILNGSVELAFDPTLMSVLSIDHGSVFVDATSGTIDNVTGRVRNLSGTTQLTGVGVGEYALLGRIEVEALDGQAELEQLLLAIQRGDSPFELIGNDQPRVDMQPFAHTLVETKDNAPVLNLPATLQLDENTEEVSIVIDATDNDSGETLTFSLAPGAPAGMVLVPGPGPRQATINWTPGDDALVSPNPFTIQVTVTDDSTGLLSDSKSMIVTVVNVAPTANAGGPYTISEGQSLNLVGSSFDPGGENLTYQWELDGDNDFNDGVSGATPTVTWSQLVNFGYTNGPTSFDVRLRVSDGTVTTESSPVTVTLDNAPPAASITAPQFGRAGQSQTFVFFANDPSSVDQAAGFTYRIDWNNDGTVDETVSGAGANITRNRTFTTADSHRVSYTVTDQDGGVGSAAHTIHVDKVTVAGGVLIWEGTGGADNVEFRNPSPSVIEVRVNALGGFAVTSGPLQVVQFGVPGLTAVQALGGNGNDRINGSTLPTTVQARFEGGFGNDTLFGGDANDILKGDYDGATGDGSEGNDWIEGRGGNDTLYGDGADGGEGGADTILGGDGHDTIRGDGGDGAEGRADSLLGGAGNDVILGHTGNDYIDGGADNDILFGGKDGSEGDDTIIGGLGNDILVGSKGNDRLVATAGMNILIGGAGADQLIAGGGGDILVADTTDYDASISALSAIRNEWTSGGNYLTRIDNIRNGGGLNGANVLSVGDTVVDEGAIDSLMGNNQFELNWYIYNFAMDLISAKHASEQADDTNGTL